MLLNLNFKILQQALFRACLFFSLLLLFSCTNSKNSKSENDNSIFWVQNDSLIILGSRQNYPIAIQNYSSIVVLNNTALAYLYTLNCYQNIKAVVDWENLKQFYPKIKNVQNISSDNALSTEQLMALQPDLIIVNDYQLANYQKLYSKYNFLVMEEYKLPTLQQKVAYFNLFGTLFNQKDSAQIISNTQLNFLKEINFDKEYRIAQIDCFNGNFYLPNCKSPLANFLNSKNINFACLNNQNSLEIPKEKALEVIMQNDYFLVIDWDKNSSNPFSILQTWNVQIPKGKKIIYCNAVKTNYFLNMATQPSLLLNDLKTVLINEKKGKYFSLYKI